MIFLRRLEKWFLSKTFWANRDNTEIASILRLATKHITFKIKFQQSPWWCTKTVIAIAMLITVHKRKTEQAEYSQADVYRTQDRWFRWQRVGWSCAFRYRHDRSDMDRPYCSKETENIHHKTWENANQWVYSAGSQAFQVKGHNYWVITTISGHLNGPQSYRIHKFRLYYK